MNAPALTELAQLDQWVVSKLVNGQKPPFSPLLDDHHDKPWMCSHSDPEHWSSYDVALTALPGFDWLGFVFSDYDPYSGIDLDGCRNPKTGAIEAWAQRIIDMCASYTEISPSKTGVKIFVRGTLPEQLTHSLGPHKGIEVYSTKRFFTVTGQHLAGTPTEIRDAQYALDFLWAEYHKTVEKNFSQGEKRATVQNVHGSSKGHQNAGDVIAHLNQANDLGALLEDHGAARVGKGDDTRHYSGLDGDTHSNALTYTVSVAKSGGHIGYSHSPNGKLNKSDFPKGFDWFTAYVVLKHGSYTTENRIAALKELNPIIKSAKSADSPQPARYTDEQRAAYNAARRDRRHQETREAIDAIYDKACNLEMSERAHLLLAYLQTLAYDRGVLQVAPTNEQITTDLDMCKRYVQYAFRELEAAGLGKRTGGRNVEGNEAAVWTFYRSPNLGCKPHQEAECTLDIYSIDLIPDLVACERGGAATLDEWEWCDDGHGADELSTMVETAEPEAEIGKFPISPTLRRAAGRYYVSDGARFGGWAQTEAGAWQAWSSPKLGEVEPARRVTNTVTREAQPHQDAEYAASYTPVELPDKPYTGSSKRHMSYDQRAELVRESMRPLVANLPQADDQAEITNFVNMPRKPAKARKPAALDRYVADLARMSPSELAGELKKHTATLRKHHGAHWLAGIRDRLHLVEREIDARDVLGGDSTPTHKLPPVGRAAVRMQGAFL